MKQLVVIWARVKMPRLDLTNDSCPTTRSGAFELYHYSISIVPPKECSLPIQNTMATSTNGAPAEKTYFEQQRELLVNDVAAV